MAVVMMHDRRRGLVRRDRLVVAMYQAGRPRKEVAAVFGVTPQRVSQILDRAGVVRIRKTLLPVTCPDCGQSYARGQRVAHRRSLRHQDSVFWRGVDRTGGPGACWPHSGPRLPSGHVPMSVGGEHTYAHRIALALGLGRPIRPGMFACHRCDNPPCCNPGHLYEGTPQTNATDRQTRGRSRGRHSSDRPAQLLAI